MMMGRVSYRSSYVNFKEDFCRKCTANLYHFNGVGSFVDILNGELFNTDKRSWDAYYHMDSDEGDKCRISQKLMW